MAGGSWGQDFGQLSTTATLSSFMIMLGSRGYFDPEDV